MSKQEKSAKKTLVDTFFEEEQVPDDKGFLLLLSIFSTFLIFSLGCTFYGYVKFIQWIIESIKTLT